ncbi:hypothetical protein M758_4G160900 [Ceratodon purpureus]|nr:hypothetical protein M758_4G160900 [Ceratodon purpureus]
MTKRPRSSNISYQQNNAVRFWQAWVMSLMLVCVEAMRNSGPDRFCYNRPDGSFDFFYLVLQWPGSFCSRGCCFDSIIPASQFTIHGLWPMHVGGTSPCFCKAPYYPDDMGTSRRDAREVDIVIMSEAES